MGKTPLASSRGLGSRLLAATCIEGIQLSSRIARFFNRTWLGPEPIPGGPIVLHQFPVGLHVAGSATLSDTHEPITCTVTPDHFIFSVGERSGSGPEERLRRHQLLSLVLVERSELSERITSPGFLPVRSALLAIHTKQGSPVNRYWMHLQVIDDRGVLRSVIFELARSEVANSAATLLDLYRKEPAARSTVYR